MVETGSKWDTNIAASKLFQENGLSTEIWSQVVPICKQVPSLSNYMTLGKLLKVFEQ